MRDYMAELYLILINSTVILIKPPKNAILIGAKLGLWQIFLKIIMMICP